MVEAVRIVAATVPVRPAPEICAVIALVIGAGRWSWVGDRQESTHGRIAKVWSY
jgi:hypothetical protein